MRKCAEKMSPKCRNDTIANFKKCAYANFYLPQSRTCLTADPGVSSLILARSHTFEEIDHEIISTAILLPSAELRRVVVSYTGKYIHEVLVNSLVKLAQEKVGLGELTVPY